MGIEAIETRYKGHRFRSRLEARWAVYFDALGIRYEYEPEGFDLGQLGYYLPDFWLPQVTMWAEVKPREFSKVEKEKARVLAEGTGYPVLLLDGPPELRNYWAVHPPGEGVYDWFGRESCLNDYLLTAESERRFFGCTGLMPWTIDRDVFAEDSREARAVHAARSARFEHGESGGVF